MRNGIIAFLGQMHIQGTLFIFILAGTRRVDNRDIHQGTLCHHHAALS